MTNTVQTTVKPSPRPKAEAATTPKPNPKPQPTLVLFGTDSLGKPHASWFAAEDQDAAVKAAALMGFRVLTLVDDAHRDLARKLPRGRLFEGGRAFVPFVKVALHDKLIKLAAAATQSEPDPAPTVQPNQHQARTDEQPSGSAARLKQQSEIGSGSEAASAAVPAAQIASASGSGSGSGPGLGSPPSQAGASSHRRPEHWDEIAVGDVVLAYDPEPEGWFDAIVLRIEGDLLRLRWRDYPLEPLKPQRRDQLALLPPSA